MEYSNFYPKGSKPARLYETPKIDKAFLLGSLPHIRSIVSSIGTYNYNLAQSLVLFFHLIYHPNTPQKTVYVC